MSLPTEPDATNASVGPVEAIARGRRVLIRHPTAADREAFLLVRRRSRPFHEPWNPRPPAGIDPYADSSFDRLLETACGPCHVRLLVCVRRTGAIAGAVNFNEIIRGPLQQAFVGYWADIEHTGCGYLTEGMRLALRHAFESLRLHRIEANIQPHNAPSLALAQRCGFRREGYSPHYLQIAGEWRDHERWAMTLEDWKLHRGRPVTT